MNEWTSRIVSASSVEEKAHNEFRLKKQIEDEKKTSNFLAQIKSDLKKELVRHTLSDDLEEREEIQSRIEELRKELYDWESGKYGSARPGKFVNEISSNKKLPVNDSLYFRPRKRIPSVSINPYMSLQETAGHSSKPKRRDLIDSSTVEAERIRMRRYVNRNRVDEKHRSHLPVDTSSSKDDNVLLNSDDLELEKEFAEVYSEGTSLMPNGNAGPMPIRELWESKTQPKIVFSKGLMLPAAVWDLLFPHQQVAIQWLFEIHTLGVGGILADEMGLGKTIEIAVFLGAMQYSGILKGMTLIACPATVLAQWMKEMKQWVPCVPVHVLHASMKEDRTPSEILRKSMQTNAVVLTTYATMLAQSDLISSLRKLHYVFLDEGHYIRNYATLTAKMCHRLPTPHRIISTGTPIQNSLQELWGIFHFVHPALLGTLNTFNSIFSEPIRRGSMQRATRHDIRDSYEYSRQLKARIAPFFLRRLKCEVNMRLHGKTEDILYVKLTDPQLQYYRSILASQNLHKSIEKHKVANQIGAPRNSLGETAEIFRSITYLRKLCNHAWLVQNGTGKITADNLQDCLNNSAKFGVLFDLIAQWHATKEKAVVYSQSRAVLDLIENYISSKNELCEYESRLNYVRIDGGTAISHRSALISALNSDPQVHLGLFTTRVGGLGINLTGCTKVVIFDPDWNPIIDIQSRERVWRYGQKKDVAIYRLICAGTIEEKIYHRQLHKLFTMQSVLSKQTVNLADMLHFTPEEVSSLFSLGPEYNTDSNSRYVKPHITSDSTLRDSNDPLIMLKTVFDTKGVLHVDSFDQIARKMGIDEHPRSTRYQTPAHVVEAQISALGKMERPACDRPRLEA